MTNSSVLYPKLSIMLSFSLFDTLTLVFQEDGLGATKLAEWRINILWDVMAKIQASSKAEN